MPPFAIRPAQRPDCADLLTLIAGLAEYERLTHLVTATEDALAAALFGERPVAEALIARESGQSGAAVGFALFFPNFSTFLARPGLWLEDLFVVPTHRGRGIGRALLAEVGALARARGCGRLEWAVLDWNRSAIAFYEGMGATVMPDWRICRVTGAALSDLGRDAPGAQV